MGYDADAAEERHLQETWGENLDTTKYVPRWALDRCKAKCEQVEALKDALADALRDVMWWYELPSAVSERERAKEHARKVLTLLEEE